MPVYVDSERSRFGRMIMYHMIADTPAELHAMADAIGMKRVWYQSPHNASFPHYDLSLTRRAIAVAKGAIQVTRRELAMHMGRIRASLIMADQTWQTSGWL